MGHCLPEAKFDLKNTLIYTVHRTTLKCMQHAKNEFVRYKYLMEIQACFIKMHYGHSVPPNLKICMYVCMLLKPDTTRRLDLINSTKWQICWLLTNCEIQLIKLSIVVLYWNLTMIAETSSKQIRWVIVPDVRAYAHLYTCIYTYRSTYNCDFAADWKLFIWAILANLFFFNLYLFQRLNTFMFQWQL